jgi:hypothetical protein
VTCPKKDWILDSFFLSGSHDLRRSNEKPPTRNGIISDDVLDFDQLSMNVAGRAVDSGTRVEMKTRSAILYVSEHGHCHRKQIQLQNVSRIFKFPKFG